MIYHTLVDSMVGPLGLAGTEGSVCALTLGAKVEEKLFTYLSNTYPEAEVMASGQVFNKVINQLNEYFSGNRTEFEIKLTFRGTDFQKKVWSALQEIPYGQLISYGELALRLNNPGGMRAVGAANGQNPIPIIIPCHRVIAADGSLGGYTGGLKIKHKLLNLEQQKYSPTLF
ncbi:methylated-DNA--[protein]-cysteine S-methyltransferase [bacterium]|nr:methylated-DNA--[protein]-cysteine S-methyltransferase [bacterium]